MDDEQHAGESIGDKQGARRIAKSGFARIAGFDQFQRSAAGGLQLVIEDGFFPIVGFAVLSDHRLRYIFRAHHVGGLLEVFFDRFAGTQERIHRRR